jgi:uncharacterized damage-inducible protein DinB
MERLKELPEEIYREEIKSVFPSIAAALAHIYSVDAMWFSVMAEKSFEETMELVQQLKEETKEKSLDEMSEMYDRLSEKYKQFLDEQEDLDQPRTLDHPHYGHLDTKLSELIRHVVNHGTYHRGNITAMLRQLGHPGIPTDYVTFLYAIQPTD